MSLCCLLPYMVSSPLGQGWGPGCPWPDEWGWSWFRVHDLMSNGLRAFTFSSFRLMFGVCLLGKLRIGAHWLVWYRWLLLGIIALRAGRDQDCCKKCLRNPYEFQLTAVWYIYLELLFMHVFWKYPPTLADLHDKNPTSTANSENNECSSLHAVFWLLEPLNRFRSVSAKVWKAICYSTENRLRLWGPLKRCFLEDYQENDWIIFTKQSFVEFS